MKTIKTFFGKNNRLQCELRIDLHHWKLSSSLLWPKTTLNALENFLHKQISPQFSGKELWSINVIIVGQKKMQTLNREYRNKNYTTDVLSFPAIDWKYSKLLKQMAKESDYCLGDIVICKDVMIRQAKQFKLSIMEEYLHLLVHGFLHLLGYDHEISQKEAKIMEGLEKTILDEISRSSKRSKT